MAREKYQIKDTIITELAGLGLSESSVAIWNLLVDAVVSVIYIFEGILDLFRADIETRIDAKRIGSLSWYIEQAKAFQLGDDLQFSTDGLIYYPTIDAEKQIIAHANAIQALDTVTIKVAKLSAQELAPLNAEELLQFTKYMNDVMIAGTKMNIVSLNADTILVEAIVYYNPIYSTSQMDDAIDDALYLFKTTFSFGNYLLVNDFIEYMRDVAGIEDIEITTLEGTSGVITETIDRIYEIKAGYFNFDGACVFTLESIL